MMNIIHVKNYEEPGILASLKANKLACHNFMDAGGRQKTHGSEEMDILLLTIIAIASV